MSPVPAEGPAAQTRELLSDSVRRSLLVAILDGTLVAGERLHDDELVAWLGVSRTPIRTALGRLAEIGLVEMEPNRFTRVAVPTRASLVDTVQVYGALHAWVAESAVVQLRESDVDELERRCRRVAGLASTDRPRPWTRDDLAVVDGAVSYLSDRAGNPFLLDLLFEIRVRLAFSVSTLRASGDSDELIGLADGILAASRGADGPMLASVLRERLSGRLIRVGGDG